MSAFLRRHPALLVGVFGLCWALVELAGPASGVTAPQVVWTRYGVHLTFMLLVFGPREQLRLVRSPRLGTQIVGSLLMFGMPICFILVTKYLSGSDSLTLLWCAPLLVLVLAAFTSDTHADAWTWIAGLLGFAGVVLLYHPDRGVTYHSAVFGVVSALCFALYLIVMRSMRSEPIMTKLFHTALWVFLAMSVLVPMVWQTPTPRGLAAMTAVGLLGWAGLYALDSALEVAPPALLAPALYAQLVWDALFHWPWQHAPAPRILAGFVLVLGASLAPVWLWHARHRVRHGHVMPA